MNGVSTLIFHISLLPAFAYWPDPSASVGGAAAAGPGALQVPTGHGALGAALNASNATVWPTYQARAVACESNKWPPKTVQLLKPLLIFQHPQSNLFGVEYQPCCSQDFDKLDVSTLSQTLFFIYFHGSLSTRPHIWVPISRR